MQQNSDHVTRLDALKRRKIAFGEKLLAMDQSLWHTKPKDGGFTPAELMAHLMKAEEFNLNFLRKTSPKQLTGRSPKLGFMYKSVLKRTSTPPMLAPSKSPDIKAEFTKWQGALGEVDRFFAELQGPNAPFIKMNFLFGTLSAEQFLAFQEAHMGYHEHYFPKY